MTPESNRYDTIGAGYTTHRRADTRIVKALCSLLDLPSGSLIADIGAGTGNYSFALAKKGYHIKAVEPSDVMRTQARENERVEWINGTAESTTLPDDSVDGVVIVLALHHFASVTEAARETHRICPQGPVVILTIDPRESAEFWIADYFPELSQKEYDVFPPIDTVIREITSVNDWGVGKMKFPLPPDLTDRFMTSGWRTPEAYLDRTFRMGASFFALAPEEHVAGGLDRLRRDLESGAWDRKYGYVRQQSLFEAGYQFLKFESTNKDKG